MKDTDKHFSDYTIISSTTTGFSNTIRLKRKPQPTENFLGKEKKHSAKHSSLKNNINSSKTKPERQNIFKQIENFKTQTPDNNNIISVMPTRQSQRFRKPSLKVVQETLPIRPHMPTYPNRKMGDSIRRGLTNQSKVRALQKSETGKKVKRIKRKKKLLFTKKKGEDE